MGKEKYYGNHSNATEDDDRGIDDKGQRSTDCGDGKEGEHGGGACLLA